MIPFRDFPADAAKGVRFVLFDIDDTITEDGRLLEESFSAIWALSRAGIHPIPVTGRPAGWCDLIARQWPVSGVIGENGALAFHLEGGVLKRMYHPSAPEPGAAKERLAGLGRRALEAFPGLRVAKDQDYRLFDLALDFAEEQPDLGLDLARRVKEFCEGEGAVAKVSSIHVNAWYGDYDKLSMAERFLSKRFGYDPMNDRNAVVFFGDSPNDEPMFARFPLSCGVANVLRYGDLLHVEPKFVTERPFGYGFSEAVCGLLNLLEIR